MTFTAAHFDCLIECGARSAKLDFTYVDLTDPEISSAQLNQTRAWFGSETAE